jgi:hypothetical protein
MPVANISRTPSQSDNSDYNIALMGASEGMDIATLIDKIAPKSPEAMRRAVRSKLVKDLNQRGFRVTPAGRIMKK